MQIKAVINEKYKDAEIHVCKNQMDDEVHNLMKDITELMNQDLIVQAENGDRTVLPYKDVVSFYSEKQKVFAKGKDGIYTVPKKLYELEKELDDKRFIRISKSEIINMKQIQKLDMSLTGTIRVLMRDGSETYTSRRNVTKLKQALGI
ncbi:MAG: LytTR family DNA-binding domain-containing protein [Eubacteriales bacterium]|nr:LytTR family DNA-binding domain-containing protein [Eubacteriales bacterium]